MHELFCEPARPQETAQTCRRGLEVIQQEIEEIEARFYALQAEIDSYVDELAGDKVLIAALEEEVKRLRARLG